MSQTTLHLYGVILFFGSCATVLADDAISDLIKSSDISIENSIDNCITFNPTNIEKTPTGIVLHTRAEFKKSATECGCKSRILSYDVTEEMAIEDHVAEFERLYAQKIAPDASVGDYTFILSADPGIRYAGRVMVRVGCQAPD